MLSRIALGLCLSCSAATAFAADTKREALYDISGDFDHDGKPDRAVLILVGPGRTPGDADTNDRYWVQDTEHVDLAIYMGAGGDPLDITKEPTFLKENIIAKDRGLDWAVPLEVNKAGALKVTSIEGYGSSHEDDENLTIQVRDGAPVIIGYDYTWELPGATSAGCSIDLLKGNASRDTGNGAKRSKVKAEPIALKDWQQPIWDKLCTPPDN